MSIILMKYQPILGHTPFEIGCDVWASSEQEARWKICNLMIAAGYMGIKGCWQMYGRKVQRLLEVEK